MKFQPSPPLSKKLLRAGTLLGLAMFWIFIATLLFTQSMTKHLSHDEHQFVASASLLSNRGLLPYVDYPYLHMPYLVFVNALVTGVTSYDFFAVRSFVVVCDLLIESILFIIAVRVMDNSNKRYRYFPGLIVVLLYIFDPNYSGRAFNQSLPALLSLIAFLIYLLRTNKKPSFFPYFWIGICVGLATGIRLSYAVLLPTFAAIFFFFPSDQSNPSRARSILIFGTGVFLALLPAFWLFTIAPKQFIYGNFLYIGLNTIYRSVLDYSLGMTLAGKLNMFFKMIIDEPVNAIIYTTAIVYVPIVLYNFIKKRSPEHFIILSVIGLSFVLFLTAFAPTPLFIHYFVAPLPFLLILTLYALNDLGKKSLPLAYLVIGAFSLIIFITAKNGYLIKNMGKLNNPERWQTIQIHRFALEIKNLAPKGKILTLAPIMALEAGLDTYEMFTVGTFSWRTAPLLEKEERQEYQVISYEELNDFLEFDKPAAILVGVEEHDEGFVKDDSGGLERPFIEYAKNYGYTPVELPVEFLDIEPILWVR